MRVEDLRKTFEATIGTLTPSRAQQMAKGLLDRGAAKDQVSRTATDLLEWSHKNRDRLQSFIRREIQEQLKQVGVATRADVDALKKRVRDLERAAAPSGRKRAAPAAPKPTVARGAATAQTGGAKRSGAKGGSGSAVPTPDAATEPPTDPRPSTGRAGGRAPRAPQRGPGTAG
jgi:polyhydroxyalkanoate synthesis regulator phasin